MTLTDRSVVEPLVNRWVLGSTDLPLPALKSMTTLLEGGVHFCHHGTKDFGMNWVSVWGPASAMAALTKRWE